MGNQNQCGRATVASCGGGLFGWILSLFGSGTPTYAGGGQPAGSHNGWGVFGGTPTYQVAPPEPVPALEPVQDASGDGGELDQGEPAGNEILRPIAIIVRREPSSSGDGNGNGAAAG